MNLENIRIVLVETTHPGNIGASARAMKTMGFRRLVLVGPHAYPSAEATARASGADDVLYHATVVDTLDKALAGCRLVIGSTARLRHIACPVLDPRDCAGRIADLSDTAEIALLFGQERTGLTNAAIERCHRLVRIPTDEAYSSLNLAAAVQVLCYELRMQSLQAQPPAAGEEIIPAPAEELERFYEHLQQTLLETNFLNPDNPRHLMRRLRRLFHRAQPDQNEINILRGILSSVQGRKPPRSCKR